MASSLRQALLIIIAAAVLAVATNSFSPNRIPWVGSWPSISGSDSIIVPPSYEEGDPPFISLDDAAAKYQSRGVVFIDARLPEDFTVGHIKGAVNLPFDYLDQYYELVLPEYGPSDEFVIYCSGEECELSLHLGRYMMTKGFSKVFVFFGGWREWEKARLPVSAES